MADKTVRYTPEFRRQMVALARSGRTAASLSKEFGPSAMTIGTWIKQAARDAGKGDGGLTCAFRPSRSTIPTQAGPAFRSMPGRCEAVCGEIELDQPALRPLPPRAYEFAEWKHAKVHPDYHIEVGRAYYSVPHRLVGEQVDVRLTASVVEIFHGGALDFALPSPGGMGKFLASPHR